MIERKNNEIEYKSEPDNTFSHALALNNVRSVYIREQDMQKAQNQIDLGFSVIQETPDNTIVFLTPDEWTQMKTLLRGC